MPPDRRLIREIDSIYKGMTDYQRDAGQWVSWFRFNKNQTSSDPVYDTGPQRVWYPPVVVAVYLGQYRRAGQNFDDDGLYLVDRVHVIVNYRAFFISGIPDPDPSGQDHVNDRVAFDGHLFGVDSFIPQGRTANKFLTISCDLREVAASEIAEDVATSVFAPYLLVEDST
jgi:hypothetical protein